MDKSSTPIEDELPVKTSQNLLLKSLLCDIHNKQLARRELLRQRCLRKYPDDQIADFLSSKLELQ